MFCAPGLVFGGTEGVGSRFHVLRSRTRFRRYRGRRVPFSCFALPDSFSWVPRASGPVFLFCDPRLVFGGTKSAASGFHVMRSRTRFWAVPSASGPVFMFCAPGLVFHGTEGVGSRFHVLRARNPFRRYRGRRVPFSCFAIPDSFSAVPRASVPVFMFFAPVIVFGGTEGVGSRFHVLLSRTRFRRYRGRRFPFSCFRAVTRFRWYRGRWVKFSCFALPDSFSAVPRASGPVFMFCAPRLVFGCNVGVESHFHVMRSRTLFRGYRVRRGPFSCFPLPDSLSAVPRASGPVFKFCAPGLIIGGSEGVGSRFHVLRARTHFRWYRGRRVPF
jgi:hypothetical protein